MVKRANRQCLARQPDRAAWNMHATRRCQTLQLTQLGQINRVRCSCKAVELWLWREEAGPCRDGCTGDGSGGPDCRRLMMQALFEWPGQTSAGPAAVGCLQTGKAVERQQVSRPLHRPFPVSCIGAAVCTRLRSRSYSSRPRVSPFASGQRVCFRSAVVSIKRASFPARNMSNRKESNSRAFGCDS